MGLFFCTSIISRCTSIIFKITILLFINVTSKLHVCKYFRISFLEFLEQNLVTMNYGFLEEYCKV